MAPPAQIAQFAAKLAKVTGFDLLIFTVGGTITSAELRRLASVDGNVGEELQSASNNILERAGKRALRFAVTASKLRSGWGEPAETIIDAVRREKADGAEAGFQVCCSAAYRKASRAWRLVSSWSFLSRGTPRQQALVWAGCAHSMNAKHS